MTAPSQSGTAALRRLRKRAEFQRAARGSRAGKPALSVQMTASGAELAGIGFTVTKKIGNSPERNRIRRRLREAVRLKGVAFQPGHDYVLLGRREALSAPFSSLVGDLGALLDKLHSTRSGHRPADDRGTTDR